MFADIRHNQFAEAGFGGWAEKRNTPRSGSEMSMQK
jgi:hypothetical protein